MANQGKRMVNENLIALLEAIEAKGITAEDIESAVNKHIYISQDIDFSDSYEDENFLTDDNYIVKYTKLEIYSNENLGNSIMFQDLMTLVKQHKINILLRGAILDSDENYVGTLLGFSSYDGTSVLCNDSNDNSPLVNSDYNFTVHLTQLI